MLHHETILVTGAGGFIGSHLCEELIHLGANVRALVRYNAGNSVGLLKTLPAGLLKEIEIIQGDVRDPFIMRKTVSGCKYVLHLAALIGIPYSYDSPQSYFETNTLGTLNVMQACLDEQVTRVIHTSTSEVYGNARFIPINEDHPLQAQSPYSASKIAGDKIAESFHHSFHLPVVTIRPFNCYGPRQSNRAFIPAMISQLLWASEVHCGSLEPFRDYTYVKDAVQAFILSMTKPGIVGTTMNIGSGKKITMGDLLKRLMALINVTKKIVTDPNRVRPRSSEVMELICDNSMARNLLGWKPSTDFDTGLLSVIKYVQNNPGSYRTSKYVI
jgi:NAD dependent epimerase/dehydratase